MTNRLSGPMMPSGERYATAALELDSERGRCLGSGPTRHRSLCERVEERADRGVSHRFYQCNNRVRSQDHHIPADRRHPGSVLADHQCLDVGTGVGAAITGISGTWVSCSLYWCDRAEPGQHVVESDREAEGRAQLGALPKRPIISCWVSAPASLVLSGCV